MVAFFVSLLLPVMVLAGLYWNGPITEIGTAVLGLSNRWKTSVELKRGRNITQQEYG